MVTNIGFDFDGTNYSAAPDSLLAKKYGNRPRYEIEQIIHPEEFNVDKKFEIEREALTLNYSLNVLRHPGQVDYQPLASRQHSYF